MNISSLGSASSCRSHLSPGKSQGKDSDYVRLLHLLQQLLAALEQEGSGGLAPLEPGFGQRQGKGGRCPAPQDTNNGFLGRSKDSPPSPAPDRDLGPGPTPAPGWNSGPGPTPAPGWNSGPGPTPAPGWNTGPGPTPAPDSPHRLPGGTDGVAGSGRTGPVASTPQDGTPLGAAPHFTQMYDPRWNPNGPRVPNNNCGPASLSMSLVQVGLQAMPSDPQQLIDFNRKAMTGENNPLDWTNLSQVRDGALAAGAKTLDVRNLDDIRNSILNGGSVVLAGNPGIDSSYGHRNGIHYSGGHIISVTGYNPETGTYTVDDPLARGPIQVNGHELNAYMSASNATGVEGIAVFNPKQPSAYPEKATKVPPHATNQKAPAKRSPEPQKTSGTDGKKSAGKEKTGV